MNLLLPLLLAFSAAAAPPDRSPGPRETPAPAAGDWQTIPTEAYKGKRDDISFADPMHGWYGTGKGDLFRTTDGAKTWEKVSSHPGTFIRSLAFIDEANGFIGNVGTGYYPGVSDPTPLYRTADGGKTWSPVTIAGAKVTGICSIDVLRTRRLFQGQLIPALVITAAGRVGGPASLARSMDGGVTWQAIDMSPWTGMILDVHFINERTGFVAASSSRDLDTSNAQILMTSDGGSSWKEVYRSRRANELVWKISFPTPRIGYGTVMSQDESNPRRVIVKTTDGGMSWHELPLTSDVHAVELGIGFINARHGWVGTLAGGFETVDGGRTFRKTNLARATNKFRILREPNGPTEVYAIGTEVQRFTSVK